MKAKDIGINIKPPKKACSDAKCPFHGSLKVKGRTMRGFIVSKDVHTSATLETERSIFIKKYERYMKRRTRIRVHNPPCVDAQIGDAVRVIACRPLSKTKNFVIIEKVGHDVFVEQKIKESEEEEKKDSKNNPSKGKKEDKQ